MSDRPETGSMEFEDDWTGVFIRGDNAMYYVQALEMLLKDGALDRTALSALKNTLCNGYHYIADPDRQYMKNFDECKR